MTHSPHHNGVAAGDIDPAEGRGLPASRFEPSHQEAPFVITTTLKSLRLADGFWAQAGSDMTATIHLQQDAYLDEPPGCGGRPHVHGGRPDMPGRRLRRKHLPIRDRSGLRGRRAMTLDYLRDKVVESRFVSCLDVFTNGVVSGVSTGEVNNPDVGIVPVLLPRHGARRQHGEAALNPTYSIADAKASCTKPAERDAAHSSESSGAGGLTSTAESTLRRAAGHALARAGVNDGMVDDFTLSDRSSGRFGIRAAC